MADTVNISVEPKSLTVTAGETTQATVTLKNTGQTVDQFTLSVEGLQPGWFSLPVSSVALFPNDQDSLKIILSPPKAEAKGGAYPFKIKVSSQENPQAPVVLNISLQVVALPEIGLEMVPPAATGRKAHFHVLITNPGAAEADLEVKNITADGRLKLNPATSSVKIPAGGQYEADIDAKLAWWTYFFGKKEALFKAAVSMPGGAEARTVSGQLNRLPWYRAVNIRLPWLAKPPQIIEFKAVTDDNREFKLSWSVKRGTKITLDDETVTRQGNKAVRPMEARAYAIKATNKYGTAAKQVEVQPVTVPVAKACDRIRVTLSQTQLQANAGGVPVPLTVQMQNTGQIVDKFQVEIFGLEASWYTRSASSIALMPQTNSAAQIIFQPPKQKPVRQGIYPFAVSVQSQATPGDATIILGQLEVLPLIEFKAAVRPFRVTCRNKGTFVFNLTNTGVTPIKFSLSATDLDEGVRFKFKEENPVLPAWSTVDIPVQAKPKRGSIIGEKKRFDITMSAKPEGKIAQTANGELNHTPWFASWRPIIRTLRIIIALAILVIAVILILNAGGGLSTLLDSPQTWVDNFVSTIESWFNR